MGHRIVPKPWLLRLLTAKYQWVTFLPCIYAPEGRELSRPLLEHELCHMAQQRGEGRWLYLLKYLCSRSYRLRMEAEAMAVEFWHSPPGRADDLIKNYARLLASRAYLWCAKDPATAELAIRRAIWGADA